MVNEEERQEGMPAPHTSTPSDGGSLELTRAAPPAEKCTPAIQSKEAVQTLRHQFAAALKGMSPFAEDVASKKRQNELKKLPPRQRATMEGFLRGDGEKQIANRLKISAHTVHVYVKQLYARYNVSSRGELLSRWMIADFSNPQERGA